MKMNLKSLMAERKPELLTGFGLAGMVLSVVMAIKATPRAMRKIDKRKEELGVEKLSAWETVKTAGPCYIPTAMSMIFAGTCVVKNTSDLVADKVTLATGLMISEEARRAFEEKTKEVVGERKVDQIKEEVAKTEARQAMPPSSCGYLGNGLPVLGSGNVLCYETASNGWFLADHETVRRIINDLNYRLTNGNETYITLNEYRAAFKLKSIPIGDKLQWDANKKLLDPRYYADMTEDGRPYMVIDFDVDDFFDSKSW